MLVVNEGNAERPTDDSERKEGVGRVADLDHVES